MCVCVCKYILYICIYLHMCESIYETLVYTSINVLTSSLN